MISECYENLRSQAADRCKPLSDPEGIKIHIGMATCGIASGALATKESADEQPPSAHDVPRQFEEEMPSTSE